MSVLGLLFMVAALLQIGLTLPTVSSAHAVAGRSIHTRRDDDDLNAISTSSSVSVLFLLADDLGYANVGWHEDFVLTPHLTRLAKQGITLESYYVQPICSPTRSSLMTARYTYRLGTQAEIIESYVPFGVPLRERFMAEYFQAAGYATAIFGKCKRACSDCLRTRIIDEHICVPCLICPVPSTCRAPWVLSTRIYSVAPWIR